MGKLMLSLVLLLLPAAVSAAGEVPPGEVVDRFVSAFNGRDFRALLTLAHPDIEWLSVSASGVSTETRGRTELQASLSAYFDSCPSCRSEVEVGTVTGPYVAAVETAQWTSAGGDLRSQTSLCVYEILDGRVRRVWYYPAVTP
jgi:hypothetical protein